MFLCSNVATAVCQFLQIIIKQNVFVRHGSEIAKTPQRSLVKIKFVRENLDVKVEVLNCLPV